MKKSEFAEFAAGGLIYLDGATGSNLQKRGMPGGVCPDLWISENPEVLIGLQEEFLEAGANILYSPTFTANRIKLAEFGLEGKLEEMNHLLVGLSKEAVRRYREKHGDDKAIAIAGDITMTGVQLSPNGPMQFEELIDIYKEQIRALVSGGVDLIVVETMMSLQETRAAVIAAKETTDIAVIATMTFESDGKSLYGTDPLTALVTLQSLGVSAFGANCSTGPDDMLPMIKKMAEYAEVPIICKPNAGLPELDSEGRTFYNVAPAEFAEGMCEIVRAGAGIIGGCCGTTPEHIRATHEKTMGMTPGAHAHRDKYLLSSERNLLEFSLNDRFFIVGERINPTGKKALQSELREGRFDMVREFAEAQEEKGAKVLDVNVGMSGVDEKELMKKAVSVVSEAVKLPISIDTSHIDIMEAALRLYPGRALMNSISLETAKSDALLDLAVKYGAMFVLLPVSDEGLPKNLEEKKRIIHEIMDKALARGLKKTDIVVDGLVGTVGADSHAAVDTLETIRYCHEELGLATTCGLSNISFGLPERIYVNSSFLTLAINAGLTMAIANPNQDLLVNAALATDLLLDKKDADLSYIDRMNEFKEEHEPVTETVSSNVKKEYSGDEIFQAVVRGNREKASALVKTAIEAGRGADDILNQSLLPAINEVGVLFDKKKYFLPQLIASGESMKKAVDILEPYLAERRDKNESMPVVVIATVKGDIHDIGKNLVVLMMRNYGFEVHDLGKDVPKEDIIKAAREYKADIIALSALMTTTMREMKNVIEYAREQGLDCPVMIGGAVITADYAEEIHAVYSSDAADAVRVAKSLIS